MICWGTGSPLREFLHVDDLALAALFVLENWNPHEKNAPIDKNNKVRMPGQNALLSRKKAIENGIFLSKETLKSFEEIAKKFDIIL